MNIIFYFLMYSAALRIPSPLLLPIKIGTFWNSPSINNDSGSRGRKGWNSEKLSTFGLELKTPWKIIFWINDFYFHNLGQPVTWASNNCLAVFNFKQSNTASPSQALEGNKIFYLNSSPNIYKKNTLSHHSNQFL